MRTTETSLRRTTERSLGVSFETNVRRRGDVLMGRRHYVSLRRCHEIPISYREDVPLRRLGDIPLRRCGVFHLRRTFDVTETYRETFVRRRRDVLLPGGSYKAFLKNKKGLELSPCLIFCIVFEENFFAILLFFQVSLSGGFYFVRYWDICMLKFLLARWLDEFWNQSYLFNQAAFPAWPKIFNKNANILRTKRALKNK